jgi:hypothetical protein
MMISLVVAIIFPFRKIIYDEELPREPVVFIANHRYAGGVMFLIPVLRVPVYSWSSKKAVEFDEFSSRVQKRLFEDKLRAPFPVSKALAFLVTCVCHPFISSLRQIQVHGELAKEKIVSVSVELLEEGKNILLYPEKWPFLLDGVQDLQKGAGFLIKGYHEKTGKIPPVVPIAIDGRANVRIGAAIRLDPQVAPDPAASTLVMERALKTLYQRLKDPTGRGQRPAPGNA